MSEFLLTHPFPEVQVTDGERKIVIHRGDITFAGESIFSEYRNRAAADLIDLRERAIRDALIQLGWTPPANLLWRFPMSNHCHKCGAAQTHECAEFTTYKCHTLSIHTEPSEIDQSSRCKGRQEARDELLKWHTGEPPEGVKILIKTGDGCIVLGIRSSRHMWVDGFGIFRWLPEFTWRVVQP